MENTTEAHQETTEQEDATSTHTTESQNIDDLKFYLQQVFLILKPVIICMILSILWIKIVKSGVDDGGFAPSSYNYLTGETGGADGGFVDGLVNALIILSQIILATIIILLLFKYNCMKVLIGIFVLIVIVLLGLFGYDLIAAMCYKLNIPMDWVTMVIILWNFAWVGVVCVFWNSPLWLQQAYLVVMSSLMAFSFTGLPQFTTWILLALLACWDLFAVLAPIGPLKLLIESSRDNDREIPALLYSVAVWMMAWEEPQRSDSRPQQVIISSPTPATLETVPDSPGFEHPGTPGLEPKIKMSYFTPESPQEPEEEVDRTTQADTQVDASSTHELAPPVPPSESEDEEEAERSGLKLGLGDFVFYSVMVSRAALSDWVTTITVSLAAITGLVSTIFLLVIFKKALPALPISIFLGLIFYFCTSLVIVPWIVDGMTPYTQAPIQFWGSPVEGMPGWQDATGEPNWLVVGTRAGGQVFF
jgi:presenilin 1